MEDDNYVLIEDDTVKAISFNEGISGTTAFLLMQGIYFAKDTLKKSISK